MYKHMYISTYRHRAADMHLRKSPPDSTFCLTHAVRTIRQPSCQGAAREPLRFAILLLGCQRAQHTKQRQEATTASQHRYHHGYILLRMCLKYVRASVCACVRGVHAFIYTYIHKYITLHYLTLHYLALQYLTLHYITLRCITLHCIAFSIA